MDVFFLYYCLYIRAVDARHRGLGHAVVFVFTIVHSLVVLLTTRVAYKHYSILVLCIAAFFIGSLNVVWKRRRASSENDTARSPTERDSFEFAPRPFFYTTRIDVRFLFTRT